MAELLHSENFSGKVLSGLRSLVINDQLCDLTLVADSQRMRVHRVVMAASSDYFRVILTIDMKEKSQDSITLNGVPWRGLQEVVTFAYTGQLRCTFDNITDVLLAATHLQFVDAIQLCSKYLTGLTSVGNCVDMYNISEQFNLIQLKEKAMSLILDSFEEISKKDLFLEFSCDFLVKVLGDDRLNVRTELRLFELVMKWINQDRPERLKHASELIGKVRLPLIKPADLVTTVMNESLMKQDQACLELILEANKYHMLPDKQPLLQNERTHVRTITPSIIILDLDDDGPHVFDLVTKTWGSLKFANVETFHAQVCVIENFMYICGGIELYSTNNPVSAKCYRYDPRFDSWTEISPMQEPRHHFTLVGDGESMFAIGGYCGGLFKNVVEQYDIHNDRWMKKTSLDVRLSAAASAVHNSNVYVVGGQTDKGITSFLWSYNISTDSWQSKAPMSSARMDHTVCSYANRLFVIGGYDKDIIKAYDISTVECYEIECDQWTVVCENTPKISGINSCLIDHHVYMVGGFSYDENKKRSEIRCYNIKTNEWHVVGRIHSPAMAVPCCALYMPSDILREITMSL